MTCKSTKHSVEKRLLTSRAAILKSKHVWEAHAGRKVLTNQMPALRCAQKNRGE